MIAKNLRVPLQYGKSRCPETRILLKKDGFTVETWDLRMVHGRNKRSGR